MSDLIHENIQQNVFEIKSVTLEEKRTVEDASDRLKVSGHKKSDIQAENSALEKMLGTLKSTDDIYSELERDDLRRSINQNGAALLYNDKHLLKSDSDEMISIKAKLSLLDKALYTPVSVKDMQSVFDAYDNAVDAMDYYLSKKNPWFPEGKRRKRRVANMRKALLEEKDRLKDKAFSGDFSEALICANDILRGEYVRPLQQSAGQSLALQDTMMFSQLKDSSGNLDPGLKDIKDAYRKMTRLLNKEISDASTNAEYENDNNAVATAVIDIVNKCRNYVKGLDSKSDHDSIQKKKAISEFAERMNSVYSSLFSYLNKISLKEAKGSNYLEAFEALEEGYLKAKMLEGDLKAILTNTADDDMQFLEILGAVEQIETMEKREKKHEALREFTVPVCIDDIGEKRMAQIIEYRGKALTELHDAYERYMQLPVPKEYLKDEKADPNNEVLRDQYARLMLNLHPAQEKIRKADSFPSMIAMEEEKGDAFKKVHAEVKGKWNEDYRKKVDTGGDISSKVGSSLVYPDLKKEKVRYIMDLSYNLSVQQSKKILGAHVGKDFMGYSKDLNQQLAREVNSYNESLEDQLKNK